MTTYETKACLGRRSILGQISISVMLVCFIIASTGTLLFSSSYIEGNGIVAYCVSGVLGCPCSIALFVIFLRTSILHPYRLVIDEEGLIDKTSIFSPGEISWKDISGITLEDGGGREVLSVSFRDPEAWLASARFLARPLAKANLRLTGMPARIDVNALGKDVDPSYVLTCISSFAPRSIPISRS